MIDSEKVHVMPMPADRKKIQKAWRVAGILALVTAFELVVAFSLDSGVLKTAIFVGMTIVKAAYIVGDFMHLRHEAKALMWSILIPMLFVLWLVIALVYEGSYFSTIVF